MVMIAVTAIHSVHKVRVTLISDNILCRGRGGQQQANVMDTIRGKEEGKKGGGGGGKFLLLTTKI